jgi:hypothetical protein
VDVKPAKYRGRGIIPEYPLTATIGDGISGRDTQLECVEITSVNPDLVQAPQLTADILFKRMWGKLEEVDRAARSDNRY